MILITLLCRDAIMLYSVRKINNKKLTCTMGFSTTLIACGNKMVERKLHLTRAHKCKYSEYLKIH